MQVHPAEPTAIEAGRVKEVQYFMVLRHSGFG